MLEIGYAPLADIQFYQSNEENFQVTKTGYAVHFPQRPYKNRFFVLPISVASNSNQYVYLRIQTPNAMVIPARLWEENDFLAFERKDNIIQAMYFGVISSMILYNLFLFGVLRDYSYFLYVMFSCFTVLSMIFYSGISNELFPWSDTFFITKIGTSVATSVTVAFLLLFMREMLNTAIIIPKVDVVIKSFVVINALMPIFLLMPIENIIKYKTIILLISVFLILIVSFICMLKNQRSAYFFMLAFAFLFLTILSITLNALSILSFNVISSTWKLQFGSTCEMLILAFTLSDRFNVLRSEKETAQTNLLQAQQLLMENLKSSEQILEIRVLERTVALKRSEAKLKQLLENEYKSRIEQSQFMTMLSHELKTPLAVIRMTLGSKEISPEILFHSKRAVADMDNIVERCLQSEKLFDNQISIAKTPCALLNIINNLCYQSNAQERFIIDAKISPTIVTDEQLLHTVLSNLIDNAMKYSSAQSSIHIVVETDNSGVSIAIQNLISVASCPDSEKVFQKYYRHKTAYRKTGSGLGLYLVKTISQLIGGDVFFNHDNTSVTFKLWLPL